MKLPAKFPAAVLMEAGIVIGGALLGALIIGQWPAARAWIARQWAPGDCDCRR